MRIFKFPMLFKVADILKVNIIQQTPLTRLMHCFIVKLGLRYCSCLLTFLLNVKTEVLDQKEILKAC